MLNRKEVLSQLQQLTPTILPSGDRPDQEVHQAWIYLKNNQEMVKELIAKHRGANSYPWWTGDIALSYPIERTSLSYTVIGVDGSQIYPDRHYGALDCYLINLGGVILTYGDERSEAIFFNEPKLFTSSPLDSLIDSDDFSKDLVDLERERLEFVKLFDKALEVAKHLEKNKIVCLVDGSLIFWHLENKQPHVKDHFFDAYLFSLKQFARQELIVASYVSLPRTKEIIHTLRLVICNHLKEQGTLCSDGTLCSCKALSGLIDTHLLETYLLPYNRSPVFMNLSPLADLYLEQLRPCFFYLHVGSEIVRVELAWGLAQDEKKVDFIARAILDQAVKGLGYPVALAEAHEQAVVKGLDREFFYQMLTKIGVSAHHPFVRSQKSLKKRRMAV